MDVASPAVPVKSTWTSLPTMAMRVMRGAAAAVKLPMA